MGRLCGSVVWYEELFGEFWVDPQPPPISVWQRKWWCRVETHPLNSSTSYGIEHLSGWKREKEKQLLPAFYV